ncbi:SGNH/GDSL hydrolase family protein [Flavobacterium cellulosilyticum]|uniref:SGNH/GDSL hydrolase family protein n=1 Tax=Flavobacterium cellulosilyticum TaxID=2541731 RepID=A0A4R5C8V5_9FLAO|nr:SGNH/GDSL hydrolase family protein [Flavobacterium cellulosilyticum]TDD94563.1 SGNH/GDSL hydrolase family protein [Flavobacterium cellulosilyticum]
MKTLINVVAVFFISFTFLSCSSENTTPEILSLPVKRQLNYLALGDSYTIGQSVCESCRFPEQLKSGLQKSFSNNTFSLEIIATTGWTTTNLISDIATQNPQANYDFVTLLIGVNNQYQHQPFSVYEQEFPQLVSTAIKLAKGDKSKLIVVSIPDYAFTPYGKRLNATTSAAISLELEQYNTFAKNYCVQKNIEFVNITDITQQGLANPDLVASDGLHPSELAYAKFVERILPKAIPIFAN